MRQIKLLLVEDDEDDVFLAEECLSEIPHTEVAIDWVESYEAGLDRLRDGDCDICFLDYRIGGRTGIEILEVVRAEGIFIPVVLLTGVGQRDIDVAATEAGAADFLDKDDLQPSMVERTIRYAIANAKAKQELAQNSSLLQATLANASAGIAAFDPCGELAASNDLFDAFLLKFRNQKKCGSRVLDLLRRECAEADGTIHLSESEIFDLKLNETPFGGHVAVAIDVSEQQLLEESLRRAKLDAEAASRAKSAFFSNISHELRTPIHNIIGFAEVLTAGSSGMSVEDSAKYIRDGGLNLLNVVNSLLEFSRLEAGDPIQSQPLFDLDFILASVMQSVKERAEIRDIRCEITIDPAVEGLIFDEGAMRSVFTRVLENAWRYSPAGGEVSMGISTTSDGEVSLFVEDEGIGMEADFVDRILVPFAQVDNGLDRAFEGIGLGLSIVKLIAEKTGAQLHIHSVAGEGTRIDFRLPGSAALPGASDVETGDTPDDEFEQRIA